MTAVAVAAERPIPRKSLVITSAVALAAMSAGWLVGLVVGSATTRLNVGGLGLQLPAGWVVEEETDTQVLLVPRGLARDVAVVIYLADSQEASGGVDHFLLSAPDRLLLFTPDSYDDLEATFRYVRVDRLGGPDEVMGGRFVLLEGFAAAVFAPLDQLHEAQVDFERIVTSVE